MKLSPVIWVGFKSCEPLKFNDVVKHMMQAEAGAEQINVAQMSEAVSKIRKHLHAEWMKCPRAVVQFIEGG